MKEICVTVEPIYNGHLRAALIDRWLLYKIYLLLILNSHFKLVQFDLAIHNIIAASLVLKRITIHQNDIMYRPM